MRAHRLIFLLMAFAVLAGFTPASRAAAQDDLGDLISSRRYVVIDGTTGEVFAQKDAHEQVAIASLTKMFTFIEAIERAPLTMEITTDESDLFDSSSTTMGFGPGETFTLLDLLYGMMLPSGNDAAHAIARTIGAEEGDTPDQSVERFVGFMNERVRNMGLTETTLKNPHGLGVPGHVSSAHDVAVFTMYAMQYPVFSEVISTSEYDANGYYITNTNRLLNSYSGLIGGKTGYDEDSGYCLVEVAQRSDNRMISVTLDGVAPDVWYQDNVILLDVGFEQKSERVSSGGAIIGEQVSFRDPDAALLTAMVTPGASVGSEMQAIQATAQPTSTPGQVADVAADQSSKDGRNWGSPIAWTVAALVVVAAIVARSTSPFGGGARSARRAPKKSEPDSTKPAEEST